VARQQEIKPLKAAATSSFHTFFQTRFGAYPRPSAAGRSIFYSPPNLSIQKIWKSEIKNLDSKKSLQNLETKKIDSKNIS